MRDVDQAYELNNPPVIAELLEGEIVAIDLDAGTYYSIRGRAALVFNALAAGASPAALVQAAGGDGAALMPALSEFIRRCLADNLLRPRSTAQVMSPPAPVSAWTADELTYEFYTDMQTLLGLDPVHEADQKLGWPTPAETPGT